MITVKLFALIKEKAGRSELQIEYRVRTVSDLLRQISVEHPALAELIDHGRLLISVNSEFAGKDTPIRDGDEVALMPPFSGGTIDHNGHEDTEEIEPERMRVTE